MATAMDTSDTPTTYRLFEESDFEYDTRHKSRGIAIIISNIKFSLKNPQDKLNERRNQPERVAKLKTALKYVGFREIQEYQDLTAEAMVQVVRNAALKDYINVKDCICVVVMSYGDTSGVYGTDRKLRYDQLVSPLQRPSLKGIPKLLIIQAGPPEGQITELQPDQPTTYQLTTSRLEFGSVSPDRLEPDVLPFGPVDPYPVHKASDILLSYCIRRGFMFIDALCEIMRRDGRRLEIVEILTRTSRIISFWPNDALEPLSQPNKTYPSVYVFSMLTKSFYFS